LLQYVLYTDPANPLTSALATSATPTFTFNPATMTFGTTYYITAVAGNNLNGNVDPTDPCLDFSNVVVVVWNPEPTVALTATTDFCAGTCTDVDAVFTGTPPFTLDYLTPWGNFTQVFATTTATFQVCAPAGTSGVINVLATSLSDANCSCN
ncbi:MAG: hypothetical protein IT219_06865, partial [Bacteroidales bacterium]|nr:hypothetical protein [Bacteroidales bacterium]